MRLSVRFKAALLIAITEIALLGLLVLMNVYLTRRNLEDQLMVHANSTAELIAASATEPLLAFDLAQLNNLLRGVVDKYRVRYVMITDHREQVLASAGARLAPEAAVQVALPIKVAGSRFGHVTLQVSRRETEAALAQTMHSNVVIIGIEMVLVAIISLTLGWLLMRRLEALSRGAQALERGDYSARVKVDSRDELGELAARFNRMAEKLQHSMDALARSQRRFRDIADNTADWIWEVDADGRYTYSSKKVESLLGYAPEQVIGARAFDFMAPEDARRMRELFRDIKASGQPFYSIEFRAVRVEGGNVTLEANGVPVHDEAGQLVGYRGVTRDVSRRKEDEARLVYMARYDALTGLLARQSFIELLEDEIALSSTTGMPLTILFTDLDGFRLINDTHGHVAGDALLRVVADILARNAGEGNALARLGGDEFGILMRGADTDQAILLATRILSAIEMAKLSVGASPVHISASIGICAYPLGGETSETLLAHADMAMSRAKALGHNRYHIYRAADQDADNIRAIVDRRALIHQALEHERLYLVFQPIAPLRAKGPTCYYEALVRLRDADGNSYSAGEFIDTAEKTGQVAEIDKWVLRHAIAQLKRVESPDCVISINLSGRTLATPGIAEYYQQELRASGIEPRQLIFEVTETAAVADMARAEGFIKTMKDLGYRFSLDDFGVGMSSFSYLKHLAVDQIKIDGSFIRHLEATRADQIVVRAIAQVARELGLEAVAEFVEGPATLAMLSEIDVDFVQGNYIGPADEALKPPRIDGRSHGRLKSARMSN